MPALSIKCYQIYAGLYGVPKIIGPLVPEILKFLPYMGVVTILVMRLRPFAQTFVPSL